MLPFFFCLCLACSAEAAEIRKAAAVTPDPRATEVALQVLQNGGNAADAVIAAQAVLNVVEPFSSGLGGGALLLFYEARTGRIYAFDGLEQIPAETRTGMFEGGDGATGGLAVAVPGTLKLLKQVHEGLGGEKLSFSKLLDPAVRLAEDGCRISRRTGAAISGQRGRLILFEDSKKIFLDVNGRPKIEGDVLYQLDLAQTLRLAQREGTGMFYEGDTALDLVESVRRSPVNPGVMKKEDFLYYETRERGPVRGTYRGYEIFGAGPPAWGGMALIRGLRILERFEIRPWERGNASSAGVFLDAQREAFADAAFFFGRFGSDFKHAEQMLDAEIAAEKADRIKSRGSGAVPDPQPILAQGGSDGVFILVADETGNMAAYTASLGRPFGSALTVSKRGMVLNDRAAGRDFSEPAAGDLPAEYAAGTGRRAASAMAPVFIFREGRPFLMTAGAGSNLGPALLLNLVVNLVDFGKPVPKALAAPRIFTLGEDCRLEAGLFRSEKFRRGLEKKEGRVREEDLTVPVPAVFFNRETKSVEAYCHPRGSCSARSL